MRFPDGSDRPYWNTFYQEVSYPELSATALAGLAGLSPEQASSIVAVVNDAIRAKQDIQSIDLGELSNFKANVVSIVERQRKYLGQMDLNPEVRPGVGVLRRHVEEVA